MAIRAKLNTMTAIKGPVPHVGDGRRLTALLPILNPLVVTQAESG